MSNPTGSVMKHNPLAGLSTGGGMDSYLRDTRGDDVAEEEGVNSTVKVKDASKATKGEGPVITAKSITEDPSPATIKIGVGQGYQRYTFVVKEEYIEQIRRKAFWERRKIMDLLNDAVGKYLEIGKTYKAIPKEFGHEPHG